MCLFNNFFGGNCNNCGCNNNRCCNRNNDHGCGCEREHNNCGCNEHKHECGCNRNNNCDRRPTKRCCCVIMPRNRCNCNFGGWTGMDDDRY